MVVSLKGKSIMPEFSQEFKHEITNELFSDLNQMQQYLQRWQNVRGEEYTNLERLAYTCRQIQLKLKLLGAPIELR